MSIRERIAIYEWWDQWLEQKNCFKQRIIKWERYKRITINSIDLREGDFKNKEILSYPRLVFSIGLGQSFSIGPDIQIMVLGSSKGMVRLGVEAPPEIKISTRPCKPEGASDE